MEVDFRGLNRFHVPVSIASLMLSTLHPPQMPQRYSSLIKSWKAFAFFKFPSLTRNLGCFLSPLLVTLATSFHSSQNIFIDLALNIVYIYMWMICRWPCPLVNRLISWEDLGIKIIRSIKSLQKRTIGLMVIYRDGGLFF